MYHDIDNVEFVGRLKHLQYHARDLFALIYGGELEMAVKQYRTSQKFSTMKRIRMETCKHFSLRVRVVYSDKIFVKDDAVKFQCGKRNF